MTKTLTIDGTAIHDIPSFYDEINRVFMAGEDWKLGASLDALADMFRGGYGAIEGGEPIKLIWLAMERSRTQLGLEATRAFYQDKLARPEMFNTEAISSRLAALEAGSGPTYFEIVLEIIAEHPNIELEAR
ncbi:ribonuclease inhibitor [Mesorhizobium sp. CAU 1732]|uniref:barstar family protein n=1 Tax=Mesorhizobium sp. CAU 1732 TaxID=3140358 RepID=UPI003261BAD0